MYFSFARRSLKVGLVLYPLAGLAEECPSAYPDIGFRLVPE